MSPSVLEGLAPLFYQLFGLANLFVLSIILCSRQRGKLPLPPGPRPLPLLGNLFHVPRVKAWLKYGTWAKYFDSDILYLHLPFQPVIILDSAQAAHDLLDMRSKIYSDKPKTVMDELVGWDWHLALMPYTRRWRHIRRCFHQCFHSGAVHAYHDVQTREVKAFLRRGLEAGEKTVIHSVNLLFSAIVLDIVYGREITSMDDPIITTIREAAVSFGEIKVPGAFLVDTFPFLRHVPAWVPGTTFQKYAMYHRPKVYAMKDRPFNETKLAVLRNAAKPSITHSFLRQLQEQYGDKNNDVYLEYESFAKDAAGSAYGAAVETSFATICWFILAMAMWPDVQQKAQRELDHVIGRDRLPTHEDYGSLPYVQALMLESLRWVPALPLGIPHRVLVEDEYNGYRIPEGSVIIPNLWAMSRNAKDYPNPDTFDPDRYIENGHINPNVRDPGEFVFGFGRRICPGRHFAKEALFLTISCTLSVFHIRPAPNKDGKPVQLSFEAACPADSILLHPERLDCIFEARSSKAAELIKH